MQQQFGISVSANPRFGEAEDRECTAAGFRQFSVAGISHKKLLPSEGGFGLIARFISIGSASKMVGHMPEPFQKQP